MLHNTHAGQNSHSCFTVYTVALQSGGDGGGMMTWVYICLEVYPCVEQKVNILLYTQRRFFFSETQFNFSRNV